MAYTDLTDTFFHNVTLIWQDFDALAENDSYNKIPSGTVMVFGQAAAPTGWTKQTTQTGKILRVVSGSTGGSASGGAQDIGSNIAINHSHTVNAHTHTVANHTHLLDYSADTAGGGAGFNSVDSDGSLLVSDVSGSASRRHTFLNRTKTDGAVASGAASVSTTDSQLTNATFKYKDVIICSKN